MLIYLALPLLAGSSDLTRSDTDVFTVGASALHDRNLFGLAPRRDCLVSPSVDVHTETRLCGSILLRSNAFAFELRRIRRSTQSISS